MASRHEIIELMKQRYDCLGKDPKKWLALTRQIDAMQRKLDRQTKKKH